MAQVKIVWFDRDETERAEHEIEILVNGGWRIVAAGGSDHFVAFVVLQKDE
jgi:hypothetical protein